MLNINKALFKPLSLFLCVTLAFVYLSVFDTNSIDLKIQNPKLTKNKDILVKKKSTHKTELATLTQSNKSKAEKKDKVIVFDESEGLVPLNDQTTVIRHSKSRDDWERKRFARNKSRTTSWAEVPSAEGKIKLPFPAPPSASLEKSEKYVSTVDFILDSLATIFLPNSAQAAPVLNTQIGNITIDGDLSDWSINDRINLPLNLPPYLAVGDELYGKYVASPTPTYIIALKSTGVSLGPNTTFWLNTDKNAATGFLIWGQYGGAEYFVNIHSDEKPHLYDKDFGWVSSLNHAFSSDQHIIEIAIPAASLGLGSSSQSIDILGDINDSLFLFPQDYTSGGQYTISTSTTTLPPRTNLSKRVGIVYGEATKNNFFGDKTYSQLFMSLQHQAMMAGISFDLLTEDDLTNINNLVNYDALIFPFFSDVPSDKMKQIHDTLYKAVYDYGIGIITADDWMTNTEAGASLSGDAYRNMKQLLGIGRVAGEGPVSISLSAQNTSHSVMKGYTSNELIKSYDRGWYSYFQAVPGQETESLAEQSVTGSNAGSYPAVLASITGGRNVHFATLGFMADTNLVWQALQWVVYGDETSVGLKMGRAKNLFVSRNDMDITSEQELIQDVHVPLYNLLKDWKRRYNFVGSYFINIGNDPANGLWTDWNVSGPLFEDYISLGNEIGTHSWTHPHFTDQLSSSQIEFEFNQSMNEISAELNYKTWNNQNIRGGAVPGAPEGLNTANEIAQYLDYLTGGYSSSGAGYPSAFGYLTPNDNNVYLSPNMSFDFTLIEFGVPVGYPAVPVPLSAEEGEQFWANEFDTLMNHASQPIIHWPWHDYGPTISADPISGNGYTVAMFENTIAKAYNAGSEFITSADMAQRINTFKDSSLTIDSVGSTITATVNTNKVGNFSLAVNTKPGQVIHSVDGWYAYNDDHVFLNDNGGTYTIQLDTFSESNTHISKLPMRSKLIDLNGDGDNLNFTFEGKGWVIVSLNNYYRSYRYYGVRTGRVLGYKKVALYFDNNRTHSISIVR